MEVDGAESDSSRIRLRRGPNSRDSSADRKRKRAGYPPRPKQSVATREGDKDRKNSRGAAGGNKLAFSKAPRAAAITVSCPAGNYADVMRRARSQKDLEELGIGDLRTRRAVIGALVLEVPDPEGHAKADALANRMSVLFADKRDVRIARPTKRADIRVRDLDDAVAAEDVISAVAIAGGCGPGD
ncbi:uncharacterized protein LOC116846829 [Odontomachus brunneus]|uniref:uncharacterized protein LOC116846829 n=1 Tax=Odontomachus brunneus TaxID=486640 RepID=UPI0013F1EF52|nr:uncharacterized protein LOC116846829 [Odontomachus brunneus]